ncbi:MAG: ribulose phosphate epimerase [Deltaproteobacteria bacterium]|nr:ribulose phosphate epimerase [Deltaproteobacteria bacterium]
MPPPSAGDDEAGVTTSPEGDDGDDSSSTSEGSDEAGSSSTSSSEDDETFIPDEPDVPEYCDLITQDCPEGEKCVAYGSTGGYWDATKCTPVKGDQKPGEPCVLDGIALGTDDCDETGMCVDVEEIDGQLLGTCALYCTGTLDTPMCPPGYSCVVNSGPLAFCYESCDPLLQDCQVGLACYWANDDFHCVFTTEDIPTGEPCGYINDCAKGNICLDASLLPECAGSSCCVPYCDLADPDCASLPTTECVPFFERDTAPPGYEQLGVCIVPD